MQVVKSKRILNLILFERMSARVLLLVLSLLAAIFGLVAPLIQKEFIDRMLGGDDILNSSIKASQMVVPNSHITIHGLEFLGTYSLEQVVFLAFFILLLSQLFTQLANYIGSRESVISQGILGKLIYDKALNLRVDAASQYETGEVVSFYATDVSAATILLDQTFPFGAATFFPFVLAPIVISSLFEIPVFWVVTIMVMVSGASTFLAFRQSKFFFTFKKLAAQRLGLVNEWIQSIRTIRILGWMTHFEKRIFETRKLETENRVRMVTNGQIMNGLSTSVTFFLNIVGLISLIYFGKHKATSGELLALLWILGVFLTRPFRQLPWFFTFAFDAITSIRRIQNFLDTPNTNPVFLKMPDQKMPAQTLGPQKLSDPIIQAETSSLVIEKLNLKIQGKPVLTDVSFKMSPGEFVALVGEVGSGKSMLLLSLLGETGAQFENYQVLGERVETSNLQSIKSHFAFVPQEGFIMSASLRDNVAFEYQAPVDSDKNVNESLQRSQFVFEKENLTTGLDTEIGERGVNLSGGQKQRVNLARSQFEERDIILLDDCLSAVDVNTERLLVRELLHGIWKGKTRLLSTHRLSILEHVDRIFFLKDGKLHAEGSLQSLIQNSSEFREYTHTMNSRVKT